MNEGKLFEKDFEDSCKRTDFFYLRLVDSAKWIKGEGSSFTPSNKCDSLMLSSSFLWLFELKSTKGASISFYPHSPWIKPKDAKGNVMIKPSQVKSLMEVSKSDGIIAGFILNFRKRTLKTKNEEAETYFVHINDFVEFATKTGKSGINREEASQIGVKIVQTLKKTRYQYDIVSFATKALARYMRLGYISSSYVYELVKLLNQLLEVDKNDD